LDRKIFRKGRGERVFEETEVKGGYPGFQKVWTSCEYCFEIN